MTDNTTMIDRVARAIEESIADQMSASWDKDNYGVRYMILARAAIEAMMDPTPQMLDAKLGSYSTVSGYLDDYTPKQVYQAMIKAALEEKE